MLLLDNIVFSYKANTNQYRFSLELARGKIATVHGRSGSGKSTLLDLIAGFLQPQGGAMYWRGNAFTGQPPNLRPVTTIFQRNNLFEHRSALDNVVVGVDPSLPKQGENVDRAIEALKYVGLEKQIHQRAVTLSGGQQQRVAIARVILRRQGIVLLDEPFSALDPQTRNDMLALIKTLATEQQSAVIMVTHDQRDADAIADSQFLLHNGELTAKQP
jgi:thiamine transport system ATP-binding protein